MKTILTFIFSFLLTGISAQSGLDSLWLAVTSMQADTGKVNAILALSSRYKIIDKDTSLMLLEQAKDVAEQLGDADKVIETYRGLGDHYHLHGNYSLAKKFKFMALSLAEAEKLEQHFSGIYNELGLTYWKSSKLDSAFHYFMAAEKAFIKMGRPYEMWKVYINLGRMYRLQNEFADAEKYMEKAWEIVQHSTNRMDVGFMLYMLADIYFETENFEKFGEITEKWIAFKRQSPHKNHASTVSEHSFLSAFFKSDEATIQKLEDAVQYQKDAGSHYRAGTLLVALGDIRAETGDQGKALTAFLQAENYLNRTDASIPLGNAYFKIYKTNKALGNLPEALKYFESYHALSDSLREEEVANNLKELEVKYETEKKEQELAVQALEIKQKTFQRNALLGSSVLFALLGLTIFTNYRNRLRTNKQLAAQQSQLQDQKIKRLEQEKKLTTLQSMIEGQEKERSRIANDLHDSLGGLLTSIKSHFNALNGETRKDELYEKTNQLIDTACVEVRRVSHNMMPRALALSGLKGALEDLAKDIERQDIHCDLELIGVENNLSQSQSVMIYRLIQELTNNILKHAGANNILLQLIQYDSGLSILVEDDGKGFDVKTALLKKGLGLSSVSSRVEFLQGEINWDSVPGEGTTISITLPVN